MSDEYKPSLTRLRLKNWRSIKEETIEFETPITVFIGANSSGKTNIVDALHFLRQSLEFGENRAMAARGWIEGIHTIGIEKSENEPVEIEFSFVSQPKANLLTYRFAQPSLAVFGPGTLQIPQEELSDTSGHVWMRSAAGGGEVLPDKGENGLGRREQVLSGDLALSAFGRTDAYPPIQQTFQYIMQRWQMLDANFSPTLRVPTDMASDLYVIDRHADNLLPLLDHMRRVKLEAYNKLSEDFRWFLGYVNKVDILRSENQTKLVVEEKAHGGQEAPTISTGTARSLAMMAAYYALDMQYAEMPGLVVIEEPDTALNPWLLQNFVEQLRNYTERDGYPRQFILTTHNPHLLDYFQPEEVRVVERDDQGYTTVRKIPDHIKEIWLDKYTLGEVWLTNSFGGVPE